MQAWIDWAAIVAAALLGALFGASVVALRGPFPAEGWPEIVVLGVFTAAGLVGAAWITFRAAERSIAPAKVQATLGEIANIKEILDELDDLISTISDCERASMRAKSYLQYQCGENETEITPPSAEELQEIDIPRRFSRYHEESKPMRNEEINIKIFRGYVIDAVRRPQDKAYMKSGIKSAALCEKSARNIRKYISYRHEEYLKRYIYAVERLHDLPSPDHSTRTAPTSNFGTFRVVGRRASRHQTGPEFGPHSVD